MKKPESVIPILEKYSKPIAFIYNGEFGKSLEILAAQMTRVLDYGSDDRQYFEELDALSEFIGIPSEVIEMFVIQVRAGDSI